MMFKKNLTAVLALCAVTALFAGCSNLQERNDSDALAGQPVSSEDSTYVTSESSSAITVESSAEEDMGEMSDSVGGSVEGSSSIDSDSTGESEDSDGAKEDEALRDRAKESYSKLKDIVDCDEDTFIDEYIKLIESGTPEEAVEDIISMLYPLEEIPIGGSDIAPPDVTPDPPVQSTTPSTGNNSSTGGSTGNSTGGSSGSVKYDEDGFPIVERELTGGWVETDGGRFWKELSDYFRSEEDARQNRNSVSTSEVFPNRDVSHLGDIHVS